MTQNDQPRVAPMGESSDSPTAPTSGLASTVRAMVARRDELRAELFAIERELVDLGAILSVTVSSAAMLRRRARRHDGTSIASQIVQVLTASGGPLSVKDVVPRVNGKPETVAAAFSRLKSEGQIERVGYGLYRAVVTTESAELV